MQIHLSPEFSDTAEGKEAAAIMRKCVHCGFCNATCPTYQLLGDELDGPRGRIYLIKQAFEGAEVTRSTQQHLDRCLTCLNCQTTCPSGVEYGHLIDIGRRVVDAKVARPAADRAVRWALKEGLTSPLFAPAMWLGKTLRPLLPKMLRDKVPMRSRDRATARVPSQPIQSQRVQSQPMQSQPVQSQLTQSLLAQSQPTLSPPERPSHTRTVLMLQGCVQPAMLPNIDRATERVLDMAGIRTLYAAGTGCCGALRTHLNDSQGGLEDMRRNIDAWMPMLDAGGVEAIISSASACALSIKEYGHALAGDAEYAGKAARISALARDLSELLPQLVPALKDRLRGGTEKRAVFHAPCTLQHGQRLRGGVQTHLRELGFDVMAGEESHLCCGSAGAYSIVQPQLAMQLRDRKLGNLAKLEPQYILSANVGCIQHLQSGTSIPVMHWIEFLEEALA